MDTMQIIITLVGAAFALVLGLASWALNKSVSDAATTLKTVVTQVAAINTKLASAETHMQHTNANIESIIRKIDKIEQHEKQLGVMEYRLEQQETTIVHLNAKREEMAKELHAIHTIRG